MNWGTLYQKILFSSGKPANQADQVKHAIVNALAHHRHQLTYFSQVRFNFTLTASQANYGSATAGFPAGLIAITGEHLFLDRAGAASDRHPLERASQEELELLEAGNGGSTSQPERWAYFGGELHFFPTPDSSTDVIRGRAFVDRWVPIVRYEAPVWKYYKPLTTSFVLGNELTDDYPASPDENPWLTEDVAAAAIQHYAEYLLWSNVWQANDGQEQKALLAYTQAGYSIDARTTLLTSPHFVGEDSD